MKTVPVREIHEIELSSICTLACVYCPHPNLKRQKAHMPWPVFERTLEQLQHLVDAGTQGEVSLCGLGEAILYPQLEEAVARIREVIGPAREFVTSTNGTDMTPVIAQMLSKYGVGVYVSLHRPEVAAPAIEMLKAAQCRVAANSAFVDSALDWAGQVDWHVSAPRHFDCGYLTQGWAVVRQDGSVDACCMDAHDLYPIGSVFDEIGSLRTRATKLCEGCNFKVPAHLQEAA
jgi:hypothetical protein